MKAFFFMIFISFQGKGFYMQLFKMKIQGTGKYHPEKIMTNDDLAKIVDTSDEWIVQRTGIKERRIADVAKGEYPSGMAEHSSKLAIKNAGLEPNDIDLILFSVTMPDRFFPSCAANLQKKLEITNKCPCLDMNAACSGWLYGMSMANSMIQTGLYKNILLVGTEMSTQFNNWGDRNTCVLFGDGSGAVVLGRSNNEESFLYNSKLGCESEKAESLRLDKGGVREPITHEMIDNNEQSCEMDGAVVFKAAVKTMAKHSAIVLEEAGVSLDDVDWFIPHQANLRIIETTAKLLSFPMEKVIVNVQKYANTSSASIPVALHEAILDGRIKRGQNILMAAFGAGLTSAAVLIKY
jgi:3-oxoacyl-[acyl-carrier-protein] synthase III